MFSPLRIMKTLQVGYVTDSEVSAGETRHKLNDRCKLCACLLNVQ